MGRFSAWLPPLVAAAVALGLLKGALQRLKARLLGAAGEAKVARLLRRTCRDVRNDIYLPSGHGRWTQIDHVALTVQGILVVETKNYSGVVRGHWDRPRWQQRIGAQWHSFQNPMAQNAGHMRAVQQAIGRQAANVPVIGHVVFTGSARLRIGRIDGVSSLRGLRKRCRALNRGTIDPALQDAWATLLGKTRRDKETRRQHLKAVRTRVFR